MNHPYYGHGPSPLARRATVPISPSVASPASMIDPNLENPTFRFEAPSASHCTANTTLHVYPRLSMANHQSLQPPNQSPQPAKHSQQPPKNMQQAEDDPDQAQSEPQQSSESEHSSPERSLPDKDVTEESIDAAYADFILYCNPSIPQDVDTEELKRGFRNPPRSDGNSFSPWTLFNLLNRLEKKEIKTWSHLVMELGVEPPDREKNQSAQKVQQYAVRLKVRLLWLGIVCIIHVSKSASFC